MERIKQVRKALKVSLAELSRRTGLFREAIAYAEREGTDPRASTLARLASRIGIERRARDVTTLADYLQQRQGTAE